MITPREKMQQARELIGAKRDGEARAILRTIDHDMARQWLKKLDAIAPEFPTQALQGTQQPDRNTGASVYAPQPRPVASPDLTLYNWVVQVYSGQGWRITAQGPGFISFARPRKLGWFERMFMASTALNGGMSGALLANGYRRSTEAEQISVVTFYEGDVLYVSGTAWTRPGFVDPQNGWEEIVP